MSMLAERKQKQKWTLCRNLTKHNSWSQDSNKIGQKLLEKMGWKEGKGLGRNEDGAAEHIKVHYKWNNNGMGFKDSVEWSQQQDNFKMLLQELGGEEKQINGSMEVKELKPQSLEEKSKQSRARVHYKKFTRGKDLSQYSEKDLANILGKTKLRVESGKTNEIVEMEKEEVTNNKEFHSGINMVDYFKNKFGNMKKPNTVDFETTNDCGNLKESSLNNKKSKRKSKTVEMKDSFVSYVENHDHLSAKENKKLKRKLEDEELPKTSKKKKKYNGLENLGLCNPAFDPLSTSTSVKIKKHVLDTISENDELNYSQLEEKFNGEKLKSASPINPEGKPSKKSKKQKSFAVDNPIFDENAEDKQKSLEMYEVKIKRSKNNLDFETNNKKLEKSKMVVETTIENVTEKQKKSATYLDEQTKENGTKKQKKSKAIDFAAIENVDEEQRNLKKVIMEQTTLEINGNSSKKQNKSKPETMDNIDEKQKKIETELDEQTTAETKENRTKKQKKSKPIDFETIERIDKKQKSLKKEITLEINENSRKKQKKSKPETMEDIDEKQKKIVTELEEITNETVLKKKKKDVKQKKLEVGVDNPCLNLSGPNLVNNTTNANFEVKRKRKTNEVAKEIEENGIVNAALEISDGDIMLNVCNEPIKETSSKNSMKPKLRHERLNRRNVYNNRGQNDIEKRVNKHTNCGIDNGAFDVNAQNIEENINSFAEKIDGYQAEVENDMNESKARHALMDGVGVGKLSKNSRTGENKQTEDGVLLRFKYAAFNKEPLWQKKKDVFSSYPRKSYKHLIRGDVTVCFKNSNLNEIDGYLTKKAIRPEFQ